jgi:hypothetical protein
MSFEAYDAEFTEETPRSSRFGWSWIGPLETKVPEPGRTLYGTPRRRSHYVPERPRTTDGLPLGGLFALFRRHPGESSDERWLLKAAECIVAKERRLARLEAMGMTVVSNKGFSTGFGFQCVCLPPDENGDGAKNRDVHQSSSTKDERKVLRAANHVIVAAGERVQRELFADARYVAREVGIILPKPIVQQLEQLYPTMEQ